MYTSADRVEESWLEERQGCCESKGCIWPLSHYGSWGSKEITGVTELPWLTRCWGPCPTSSRLLSKRKSLIRTTECRVPQATPQGKAQSIFQKKGRGGSCLNFYRTRSFPRTLQSMREQKGTGFQAHPHLPSSLRPHCSMWLFPKGPSSTSPKQCTSARPPPPPALATAVEGVAIQASPGSSPHLRPPSFTIHCPPQHPPLSPLSEALSPPHAQCSSLSTSLQCLLPRGL